MVTSGQAAPVSALSLPPLQCQLQLKPLSVCLPAAFWLMPLLGLVSEVLMFPIQPVSTMLVVSFVGAFWTSSPPAQLCPHLLCNASFHPPPPPPLIPICLRLSVIFWLLLSLGLVAAVLPVRLIQPMRA